MLQFRQYTGLDFHRYDQEGRARSSPEFDATMTLLQQALADPVIGPRGEPNFGGHIDFERFSMIENE